MKTESTGVESAITSSSGTVIGGCRERGIGLVSLLLILVLAAFVGMLGLRIAPVYIESLTVRSVVQDVAGNPELQEAEPRAVRNAITTRLRVNNVGNLGGDAISVQRFAGGVQIIVNYERRFPLVANLDGVARFREEAMVEQ